MKRTLIFTFLFLLALTTLKSDWGLFDGIVNTNTVFNITNNSAMASVTVQLALDDDPVTQKGIVWDLTPNPTVESHLDMNEHGAGPSNTTPITFNSTMNGLNASTMYYVRSFAVSNGVTYYGNQISFTTIPTLGEWGLIAFGALIAGLGGWFVWRKFS